MSSRWKFQVLPGVPNILDIRYGTDEIMRRFEYEVGQSIPYPLRFHKIQKLVIELGAIPQSPDRDYYEADGVAVKAFPDFDLEAYKHLGDEEKRDLLKRTVLEVFQWLIGKFSDAQCFETALQKLKWNEK